MKNLVEFIKESLDAQINESASVEAILMFLNRWDGECVKICDLPVGTDGNEFAKELADEFDSEDTVIEYCDDCKCIIIKPKDCENCQTAKNIISFDTRQDGYKPIHSSINTCGPLAKCHIIFQHSPFAFFFAWYSSKKRSAIYGADSAHNPLST